MRWKRVLTTTIYALASGIAAAQAVEAVSTERDLDPERLLIACGVGTLVQALTLLTYGRFFARYDRAKSKARAIITSIGEAVLAGLATAALIGFMRGVLGWDLPISAEYAFAAVAGSVGAEEVFKRLDQRQIARLGGADDAR